MRRYSPVEVLDGGHETSAFDCGEPALNEFLGRYALVSNRADGARTFVVHVSGRVVGYYTLVLGAVSPADAPPRLKKGLGAYPIGVMILARLAVDMNEQGRNLGAALLKDSMIRSARVAKDAGTRALVAHAKDERAKAFYERFGFEASPTDPLHLLLLMKDLRRWLREAGYDLSD